MKIYSHSIVNDVFILRTQGASRMKDGVEYIRNALRKQVGLYSVMIADIGTDMVLNEEDAILLIDYVSSEKKLKKIVSVSVVNADQFASGIDMRDKIELNGVKVGIFKSEKDAINYLIETKNENPPANGAF